MLENVEFTDEEYHEAVEPVMEVAEELGKLLAMIGSASRDETVRQTKKLALRVLRKGGR